MLSRQSPTPAYQSVRVKGFNPDLLAALVNDARFEQRLLRGGPFSVTHQRANWAEMALDCGAYSLPVLAQGSFACDRLCIGFNPRLRLAARESRSAVQHASALQDDRPHRTRAAVRVPRGLWRQPAGLVPDR